ncbi:MAG TPA: DUF3016 domain-containing protein [Candidatus Binatia bacterium]
MNQRSFRIFCQALLIAALHGLSDTAASAQPEHVARIHVVFVEPEKFTDARRAEFKPNSEAILDAIAKFMQEMGEETIPRDMNLDIKVTDVDLAGNFEPWHGPQSDQVRITNQLYPLRFALEYRVIDPRGQVILSGKRNLTDLDYQRRTFYPTDDYLRYEKDLLHHWFREEFGKLKS